MSFALRLIEQPEQSIRKTIIDSLVAFNASRTGRDGHQKSGTLR